MEILVAGLGSDLGADAFGWEVVKRLETCKLPRSVRLVLCKYPGELLALLLRADVTVILDACLGNGPGGGLHRLRPEEIEAGGRQVHGLGLPEVIGLARALGIAPDRLLILGFNVGTADTVLRAEWVDDSVREVLRILWSLQGEDACIQAETEGTPAAGSEARNFRG